MALTAPSPEAQFQEKKLEGKAIFNLLSAFVMVVYVVECKTQHDRFFGLQKQRIKLNCT